MKISYPKTVAAALRGVDEIILLAPKSALASGWHRKIAPKANLKLIDKMIADAEPGDLGQVTSSHTGGDSPKRIRLGVMPDRVSRHNSPTRSEYVFSCASSAGLKGTGRKAVICHVEDAESVSACASAVARTLYNFSRKSGKKKKEGQVAFLAVDSKGRARPVGSEVPALVESIRWAAEMVDTPTEDLDSAAFVRQARALVRGVKGVKTSVIVGKDLLAKGLGGLHGVGRAAVSAPRLLVLDYTPTRKKKGAQTVALVGKGVVYDTGGLNIKVGAGMSGMKADMGGAAAVVGAFHALAATKHSGRVICLAPLAENAVDKESYRPDDILKMHSGRTVEINNTDAEGRLLLADGVSYVGRKFKPDVIIDAATLTGAQLVSSGYRHAGIVSNRNGLEAVAVASGQITGEMVHPLLFAPEFYQSEFRSLIADMKNSVKNRMNAQSSCAAQFVYSHIEDLDIPWMHVDLAGPSVRNGRGSGYGVGLLTDVTRKLTASDLKS